MTTNNLLIRLDEETVGDDHVLRCALGVEDNRDNGVWAFIRVNKRYSGIHVLTMFTTTKVINSIFKL